MAVARTGSPNTWAPIDEAFVGGEGETAALIAGSDQAKEQIRFEGAEWQIAHFVDTEEAGPDVHAQAGREAILVPRFPEIGHQVLKGNAIHRDTLHDGLDRHRHHPMRFPHPRRTEHNEIFRPIHPLERQELTHLAFIEGRLEGEIILVQRLVKREMGHLSMRDDVSVLAGGHLGLEDIDQVLGIRPRFRRRLLCPRRRKAAHFREFQAFAKYGQHISGIDGNRMGWSGHCGIPPS